VAEQTVFISHSSNGDPQDLAADDPHRARLKRAREVREAICQGLPDGLASWLDSERIKAGDLWRLEIYDNLYSCAAGVLLLDEDALASDWVLQEATILNFRRRINPAFRLISVLLDGGSSQRLAEDRWKPLALSEYQVQKGPPDEIVAAVNNFLDLNLAPLAGIDPDAAVRQWTENVASALLSALAAQPARLTESCGLLGIRSAEWVPDDITSLRHLAHALISAKPDVVGKVLREQLIHALPDQRDRERLAGWLGPLWVDLRGAASTAAVLRAPKPERRPVLNTDDADTASEYVARARAGDKNTQVITCSSVVGEDAVEELRQAANQAIFAVYSSVAKAKNPQERLAKFLADDAYAAVLLVPGHLLLPDQLTQLLGQLSDDLPGVTLFVLGGPTIDPAQLGAVPGLTMIDPGVTPDDEDLAIIYREELHQFSMA
jgi:hypothetical protein